MPVRIYDISKKLGLENKEIISKAKALGIAAAKVPSSSLDKISAEWLEEELIKEFPEIAARLAPKPRAVSYGKHRRTAHLRSRLRRRFGPAAALLRRRRCAGHVQLQYAACWFAKSGGRLPGKFRDHHPVRYRGRLRPARSGEQPNGRALELFTDRGGASLRYGSCPPSKSSSKRRCLTLRP